MKKIPHDQCDKVLQFNSKMSQLQEQVMVLHSLGLITEDLKGRMYQCLNKSQSLCYDIYYINPDIKDNNND